MPTLVLTVVETQSFPSHNSAVTSVHVEDAGVGEKEFVVIALAVIYKKTNDAEWQGTML